MLCSCWIYFIHNKTEGYIVAQFINGKKQQTFQNVGYGWDNTFIFVWIWMKVTKNSVKLCNGQAICK